jgi:hypothetical protein
LKKSAEESSAMPVKAPPNASVRAEAPSEVSGVTKAAVEVTWEKAWPEKTKIAEVMKKRFLIF